MRTWLRGFWVCRNRTWLFFCGRTWYDGPHYALHLGPVGVGWSYPERTMTIPHRIAEARHRAGLSRGQASQVWPGLAEAEFREATGPELQRAATAYSVSVCWISGHDGQVIGQDLVDVLADCPEDVPSSDKDEVLAFAVSIAECPKCKPESADPETTGAPTEVEAERTP